MNWRSPPCMKRASLLSAELEPGVPPPGTKDCRRLPNGIGARKILTFRYLFQRAFMWISGQHPMKVIHTQEFINTHPTWQGYFQRESPSPGGSPMLPHTTARRAPAIQAFDDFVRFFERRSQSVLAPCIPYSLSMKNRTNPFISCIERRTSTSASAASVWGSQKVMSIARQRSITVDSSARACFLWPIVAYKVPRPRWQWAWSGRMPSASARARA